jgi:hypothetical protein
MHKRASLRTSLFMRSAPSEAAFAHRDLMNTPGRFDHTELIALIRRYFAFVNRPRAHAASHGRRARSYHEKTAKPALEPCERPISWRRRALAKIRLHWDWTLIFNYAQSLFSVAYYIWSGFYFCLECFFFGIPRHWNSSIFLLFVINYRFSTKFTWRMELHQTGIRKR